MIDAGAPAAIIAAMRTQHKDDSGVANYGCWALCNITELPAGQQDAVNVDAPAAIIAAICTHSDSADVAHFGCAALANIAAHAAGKSAIIAAGGLSVIEAAIARHDEAKKPGATVLALCRADLPARAIADMD